ncbi:MAG: RHS repeat-associated core domain-containing protein [Methyloglobulus sp.]|nr:RHS repeat protein [Methyloglobulus sp.]
MNRNTVFNNSTVRVEIVENNGPDGSLIRSSFDDYLSPTPWHIGHYWFEPFTHVYTSSDLQLFNKGEVSYSRHQLAPRVDDFIEGDLYPASVTVSGPTSSPPEFTNADIKNLGSCGDINGKACFVGNPINIGTGNKFQVETDFEGGGDFPLVFNRYYNSQSTISNGVMGAGWSHSYSSHIQVVSSTQLKMVRDDQSTLTFTLDPNDISRKIFKADADVNSRLTANCGFVFIRGVLITCANPPGYTYTTRDDKTERYDINGVLQSITDRAGRTQTLGYDPTTKRLMTITDPAGRKLTLNYWLNIYFSALIFPDGNKVEYDYSNGNGDGNQINVWTWDTATQKLVGKTHLYENATFPHALTGLVDEKRFRFANWSYDANGRAVTSEHAGGVEKIAVDYTNPAAPKMTDALGRMTTFNFDTKWSVPRLGSEIRPDGKGDSRTFDANGNPDTAIDAAGNKTKYTFDQKRNLETSRIEGFGTSQARTITTQWHPDYRLPTVVTEPLKRTNLDYYPNGDLKTRTLTDLSTNASRTWNYTYDSPGRVKAVDGPRTDVADVTTYGYDPVTKDLTSITDALGHKATVQNDANGRPKTITDPNGLVTAFTWNPRGWLDQRLEGQEKTVFTHDANGTLTKITFPGGESLNFTPDAAHRITEVKDALGNRIVYGLDAMDNVLTVDVYNAAGAKVKTESRDYDNLNRLFHAYGALKQATTFAHDGNGNVTAITDPNNHKTQRLFDALNRLDQVTDPALGITDLTHDANDGLTGNLDPKGNNTVITRNGFGEPTAVNSPDAGLTKYTYDSAGNVKSKIDARGRSITYTYDALNRETYAAESSGVNFATTWNTGGCVGKPAKLAYTGGDTAYTWDTNCHLTKKVQTVQYTKVTLAQAWSPVTGRLLSTTYPSGMTIGYGYDAAGQVNRLTVNGKPLLSNISHFPFGPARSWVWATGVGTSYARTFDQDGRLKSFPLDGAGSRRTLARDLGGLIRTITDAKGTVVAQKQTLTYTALDEVKSFSSGTVTQSYTYDKNGNRLTGPLAANMATFVEPTDRLLTTQTLPAAPVAITSDLAGYFTKDENNSYYHSSRGDMRQALPKGGQLQVYGFSNLHEPVITINNVTKAATLRLYDADGAALLGEYSETYNQPTAQPVISREYVYLDGSIPVAVTATGGATATATNLYRIYADQLDTPRTVVSADGSVVVWDWTRTDPFGAIPPTGTFAISLRFPGQHADPATGLFLNHFRNYDPKKGRYIEPDPIGLAGGQNNLFAYVGGNPVNVDDPRGLYWLRQDWQPPGTVGRSGNPIVPPRGIISQFIEKYVPAGYTFGQMHDKYVDYTITIIGTPDFIANIPSMPYLYITSLYIELQRTVGGFDQRDSIDPGGSCAIEPLTPEARSHNYYPPVSIHVNFSVF